MTDTSKMTQEQQIKREEQKAIEEKHLQVFLNHVKNVVQNGKNEHSYWIDKIKLYSPLGIFPDEDDAQYWIKALFGYVNECTFISDITDLGIDVTFAKNYTDKLSSIAEGVWIVPSCVMLKMLDVDNPKHLSLWLDLPHRSEADPVGSLSYYRTMQDVVRVRETRTKPGRWFGARELGTEAEGLTFNSHWTSTGTPPAKYFLLSETKGLSEDSWKWAYGNTDKETGSCMIKVPDAARIFAYDETLDLFYITEDDTPDGKIVVRTIIRKDKKTYVRLYSSSHNKGVQAKSSLTAMGYVEERNLNGVKLGKIRPDNMLDDTELYWLSYLDSNSDAYIVDADTHWVCHDTNYESEKELKHRHNSNYYEGQYSKGYFGTGKCSCGKHGYELYMAYSVVDDKVGTKSACARCSDKYYVKESDYSRSYYDKNHFTLVKDYSVDEDDWDEDCSYQTKVYRKGEEITLSENFVLIETSGGLLIDHEDNFKKDFFNNNYNVNQDSVRDFMEYCSKPLSEFLIKEFTESGIELEKSEYYKNPQMNVIQYSDPYEDLIENTYYDWSARKVPAEKVQGFLGVLEKYGKLKVGSYYRYLASIGKGKVDSQEKIYTFRSTNTGNMGFVLDTGETSGNINSFSAYTFVQAA